MNHNKSRLSNINYIIVDDRILIINFTRYGINYSIATFYYRDFRWSSIESS
ncbi:hypothetical protein ACN4EE_17035 [Geminocystis sp. CENA526]|uniref:hypothetical protein n=1 Tax=Geminocystis sp. CENA526 TaxID=1355871 RepID=UPI003D700356